MMFLEQSSCTRRAAAAPMWVQSLLHGCGNSEDIQPIKTVWKCLYMPPPPPCHIKTFRAKWQARVSDRLDRPLQTMNLPFNANTYGLFMVRYIVLTQLQTWAERHNSTLSMAESKLKFRWGTSGLPRKNVSAWKHNVECSLLNRCRFLWLCPLCRPPVETL